MTVVIVLASDYGQNKHELGPQSILRLRGAICAHQHEKGTVMFFFSAGRLSPEDSRLCDLQKDFVEGEGFRAKVPDEENDLVWGTKAELRTFKRWLKSQDLREQGAQAEVWTADYHLNRTMVLGYLKARLWRVRYHKVNSSRHPPTLRARCHEFLGMVEALVPDFVMALPKAIRRRDLRSGRITY